MHRNDHIAPGSHEYVPAKPAADPLKSTGYVEKEYEHQEYPKHIEVAGRTVEVRNEDEEAEAYASE